MSGFGERLKAIRREADVSQAYVAEQIGVSSQSVSNWECDVTMPDISQIVPLAAVLGVSTDCLLGVGRSEEADKSALESQVENIWANYSVNTAENNADYMVYELYRDFLKRYPLNYEIKYKCALAINDFLTVSRHRRKFDIPKAEFDKLYAECDRLLRNVVENDKDVDHQLKAQELIVRHLVLCRRFAEAETAAAALPEAHGIRDNSLRGIMQARHDVMAAADCAQRACGIINTDYLMALFYRAKCLSDGGSEAISGNDGAAISDSSSGSLPSAIAAWRDLESAARDAIRLYLAPECLAVNRYENNPYCYLITSFTSRCGDYLAASDVENALRCVELATEAALDMYRYARRHCDDELILEDVKFFASHTPAWCYKFSRSRDAKQLLSEQERYKKCVARINEELGRI